MPGAEWVGPHHNGLMSRYDIVCLHTIVGNPPAHAAHFSTRADGHIYQSRDTKHRSAANLHGNHRIIAIENDDHGPEFGPWNVNDGHAVPPFTEQQIESIAKICAWAYQTHGIPLVTCPDSKPGSRGIAFHRQGIDGNWAGYAYGGRVPGGEVWTSSRGKVCPGDRRISQISRIITRARQIAGLEQPREDPQVKNLILAREANGPKTYVGDGMFRRHVADPTELGGLQYWIKQKGGDSNVQGPWADLRVLGVDIDALVGAKVNAAVAPLLDDESKVLAAVGAPAPVQIDYDRFVDDVVERLAAKLGTLRFDAE